LPTPVQVSRKLPPAKKAKSLNWLNPLIKGLLFLALGYVIYQFYFDNDLADIYQKFRSDMRSAWIGYLIVAVVLMPINWFLESLKWQSLLRPLTNHNHNGLFQAVLSGITVSILTPNRIGEYLGRAAVTPSRHNWEVTISTMVGSFCQLIVLLAFGFLGLIMFLSRQVQLDFYPRLLLLSSALLLVFLGLYLFYNIDRIPPLIRRIKIFDKYHRLLEKLMLIKNYKNYNLSVALLLSALRYVIYSFQYILLLSFFAVNLPLLSSLEAISTQFLLQTGIPLPPLFGLIARGEISLLVFGYYEVNELSILAASFLLWGINLMIPAILGLMILMRNNILKSFGFNAD
jgi:hypothetical protein